MDGTIAAADVRQINWPQTVLVLGLATCLTAIVIVLAINGKDVAAVLSAVSVFIIAIVAALGYTAKSQIESKVENVSTKADSIKQATNGQQTELMAMIKDLQGQVAALHDSNMKLALQAPPPEETRDGLQTLQL